MLREQILGALPKLSRDDLEAIHAVTASLLAGQTAAGKPEANTPRQIIFDALAAAVGLAGGPLAVSERVTAQFNKRCPNFVTFLNKYFDGWDKRRTSQMAFLKLLFELLAEDLKQRGINPSIGIMVVNLGRMSEVFDNAFPGYREAGIASSVILRHFK